MRCRYNQLPPNKSTSPATSAHLLTRAGLTFIELLIGLSITALTCAILAVLINATAMGTSSQNDGRRALVRLESVKAVLQDEFINARAILAVGANYVVYWIGDQSGALVPANNAVNLSELRLLEIDASGNLNLYYCKWPAGTSNALMLAYDQPCAIGTDWYSTASGLKGTTYCASNTLATNVASMTASLDTSSATTAHYVNILINFDDHAVKRQLVLGVNLANPGPPW